MPPSITCTRCGQTCAPGQRFCGGCGAALEAAARSRLAQVLRAAGREFEAEESLRVAEATVASFAASLSERRRATFLASGPLDDS